MADMMTSHSPYKKKHHIEIVDLLSDDDDQSEVPAVYAPAQQAPKRTPAEKVDDDDSDDMGSLCEEFLDMAEDDPYIDRGPESLSSKEAVEYRAQLRSVGVDRFLMENITKGTLPLRKLGTAFGLHPGWPIDDQAYLFLFGRALVKELNKRQKLPEYNTVDDAVKLLQTKRNILVITGAGISTSLGIPDFRSKHTGFYSKLIELGYSDPEEVFNIENFDSDPSLFYTLASDILPVMHEISPTHAFLRLLQDRCKLLTNYTQNIDNIESYAGIDGKKLIQCHGSWATATCRKCMCRVAGETIFEDVKARRISKCRRCKESLTVPRSKKRKRSRNGLKPRRQDWEDDSDDTDYDIPEPGVMKPDITFFGEKLPNTFFDRLTDHDANLADLVIVIGTSMKVAPVSEIPNYLSQQIPHICISREPIEHINFDIQLLGDCDNVVAELCRRASWALNHHAVPRDFSASIEPADGHGCRWSITPKVPVLPVTSLPPIGGGSQDLPIRGSPERLKKVDPAKKPAKEPQIANAVALKLLNKYAGEATVKPYLAFEPRISEEGLKKLRHILKHNRKTRGDLSLLRAEMAKKF